MANESLPEVRVANKTMACLATMAYRTVCGIKVAISREPEDAPARAGRDPLMEVEVLWHGFS